jgi:hypothetical protein
MKVTPAYAKFQVPFQSVFDKIEESKSDDDDSFNFNVNNSSKKKRGNKKKETAHKVTDEFDFDESKAKVNKVNSQKKTALKVQSSINKLKQQKKNTKKQQVTKEVTAEIVPVKPPQPSLPLNPPPAPVLVNKSVMKPFKPPRSISSNSQKSSGTPVTPKPALSLENYADDDLFKDSGFTNIFNDSSDEESQSKQKKRKRSSSNSKKDSSKQITKKRKANTTEKEATPKTTRSDIRTFGKDRLLEDEIYDLLDGLNPKHHIDVQCESATSLASKFVQNPDLALFLRAHNLIETTLNTLAKCYDFEKHKLLSMLVVQIMATLLSDPLNVDYINEACFEVIHKGIKNHPVLIKLDQSSSTRTRRTRAAALSVTSYSDVVNSKQKQDEIPKDLERSAVSRALNAMSTIVARQQQKLEESLVSNNVPITESMIENAKQGLLFHKTNTISTIEKLVPSLLVQLEQKREESLAADMCKCIKMLEQSGLYKKYSISDATTHDAWNMLLPSLIRLVQCLSTTTREPLKDIPDKSPILECTVAVLKFLTNVTNQNEDACTRIGQENGLSAVIQALCSNHNKHFDIITMCCGFIANMIETNWNNRELLRTLTLPEPQSGKKFINYIVELFIDFYDRGHADEGGEENAVLKSHQLEYILIASYIAIVIGCLVREHEKNRSLILKLLPDHSFINVIRVLQQFILFQSNAKLLTQETYQSFNQIITELRALSDDDSTNTDLQ